MEESVRRVRRLYRGEGGRFWDALERERARGYLEENVVLGRRQEAAVVASWLAPAGRILDAGCGRGALALELAARGARVVAADLVPRFPSAGERPGVAFVVADFRDLVAAGARFAALVLREVLQDYPPEDQAELLAPLAGARIGRLLLTLRLGSPWTPLVRQSWPQELAGVVDPTAVLRSIHLALPFRLTRQQEIRRRNFRSRIVELTSYG